MKYYAIQVCGATIALIGTICSFVWSDNIIPKVVSIVGFIIVFIAGVLYSKYRKNENNTSK